jgi:hypothetical protein
LAPEKASAIAIRSAAPRARKPIVSSDGASAMAPPSGTRSRVGFQAVTPQHCAGIRSEPPVSEPSATGTMPAATATAEPDDDPPQI